MPCQRQILTRPAPYNHPLLLRKLLYYRKQLLAVYSPDIHGQQGQGALYGCWWQQLWVQ